MPKHSITWIDSISHTFMTLTTISNIINKIHHHIGKTKYIVRPLNMLLKQQITMYISQYKILFVLDLVFSARENSRNFPLSQKVQDAKIKHRIYLIVNKLKQCKIILYLEIYVSRNFFLQQLAFDNIMIIIG